MNQLTEAQQNSEITKENPGAAAGISEEPSLRQLWNNSLGASVAAALTLYDSDGGDTLHNQEARDPVALEFRRVLLRDTPKTPDTAAGLYSAVIHAVWQTLRQARLSNEREHWPTNLIIALRPVRRLQAGMLTAEICAALHDYCWNSMALNLTKPERYYLEEALAMTLAALPPDEMDAYWKNLQSDNPRIRQSMRFGLRFFRSAHAVPHLLSTLENVQDHDISAEIVDILEQIGEPSAIPLLIRLKQQTALTDWTLSRHIGRAVKVIERQNRDSYHQALLRPSDAPPARADELLRPASDTQRNAERDQTELLRAMNITNDEPPEENA